MASRAELQAVVERACLAGIRSEIFDEPDNDLGLTAACTEPVCGSTRRVFRRMPLWSERVIYAHSRSPP